MTRKQKLNWVTTLSAADFDMIEVFKHNVNITVSGDSGLSDASCGGGHGRGLQYYMSHEEYGPKLRKLTEAGLL